jgi:hypothetical protein
MVLQTKSECVMLLEAGLFERKLTMHYIYRTMHSGTHVQADSMAEYADYVHVVPGRISSTFDTRYSAQIALP